MVTTMGVLILMVELFCWMVPLIYLEDSMVPHLALVTVLQKVVNLVLEKVVHLVHLMVTNLETPKALEMSKAVNQAVRWAKEGGGRGEVR